MSGSDPQPVRPGSRLHRPLDPALPAALRDDDLHEVHYAAEVWRALTDGRRPDRKLRPGNARVGGGPDRECRPLLRALPAADVVRLLDLGARRSQPRGTVLFRQGLRGGSITVVLSGQVKVTAETGRRRILLDIRGPGDLLGESAVLAGLPHPGTAVAIEPVESIAVPIPEFSRFLSGSPTTLRLLLHDVSCRLAECHAERARQAALDTAGRLADRLVRLCERFGRQTDRGIDVRLEISQEELAGSIGASEKAVAHALAGMRRQGWLDTGRRHVTVRDLHALKQRCQVDWAG